MTSRDRLLASLAGERTDRLSWSPLIDNYYLDSLGEQGFEQVDVPDAVRLVAGDVLERHVPAYRLTFDRTVRREVYYQGEVRREVIKTPFGVLETEMVRSRMGHTDYIRKPLITSLRDVKTYQGVLEATRIDPDYATFQARDERIGGAGLPTASGPMTPLQEFLQILCGVENTIYLLHDHPEEVDVCFEMMHARNRRIYQTLGESPAKVIIAYENTSSTVISPAYYRRYCAPWIDEYAQICQGGGKWFITHMCGKLRAFSDQIGAGRQDGVDSLCPPSTGDLWAHEARDAWGAEKVIIGGLDPAALAGMNREQTRAYVVDVLEKMPTFRRFILSTGDATAHGTPLENLREVGRTVASYGWN
jgi:hypothetical protein